MKLGLINPMKLDSVESFCLILFWGLKDDPIKLTSSHPSLTNCRGNHLNKAFVIRLFIHSGVS